MGSDQWADYTKYTIYTLIIYNIVVNSEFKSRANSWIRYAISRNVEDVDLWLRDVGVGQDFTFEDELFFKTSCITRMTLSYCRFNPPNGAISWERLECFCLFYVTLDEDMIENILSGSPCLESFGVEKLPWPDQHCVKEVDRIEKQFDDYTDLLFVLASKRLVGHITMEGVDRLNELKDEMLVNNIMSRLDCTTKAVIQKTTTISKRWENLWTSLLHLILSNDDDFKEIVVKETNLRDYISFIDNTLNKCPTNLNLKKFKLNINYSSLVNSEFKSRANSWIRYAIRRNVEEVDLWLFDVGIGQDFTFEE
ncbi:hypothetical protein Tco_1522188 [Tanacetum coccineum]